MPDSNRRYCAFISYSQKDRAVARRLQSAMEAFRAPSGVVADGIDARTRKLGRFFRDEEDLGAASDLTEALQKQIGNADALIVVCSPHAAKSVWVNREIIHFKRTGRADRIFAVMVDGEPGASSSADPVQREKECFPPALKVRVGADGALTDVREEPLAIDLRKDGFARVRARLAAGLLGVDFDDLWRRDQRRARGRLVTWSVASAGVLVAAVATTLFLITRTQEEGDFTLFADRATAAGRDALSEMRRVASIAEYGDARADETAAAAQVQAAALAYALALSGDPARAAPLLDQLGYLNALSLPDAGEARPEPGWTRAVSSGSGLKPELIDLRTGARTPLEASGVALPKFSPDNRWASVASGESRVTVWNLAAGSEAWSYKSDSISIDLPEVAFDHKGVVAAIASRGKLRLVEPQTGRELEVIPFDNYRVPTESYDQNDLAHGLSFSLDDTRLLVLQGITGVRTYDLAARKWLPPLNGVEATTSAPIAGFDSAHALLPTTRVEGTFYYPQLIPVNVTAQTASPPIEPVGCAPSAYGVGCFDSTAQFSHDRSWMVWGANDGVIANLRMFDLTEQAAPASPKVVGCEEAAAAKESCAVHAYAASPVHPEVAIAAGEGRLLIVDAATGALRRELDKVEGSVNWLMFSDKGDRLVGLVTPKNFKGAKQVALWDAEGGKLLSRSGIVLSDERLYAVRGSAAELLMTTNGNLTTLWTSTAPAGETVADALKRVCARRGEKGLTLSDEDLRLLPARAGRSNNVCAWKVQ